MDIHTMPRGVSGFPWRERRLLRFALDEGFAKKLGEEMKAQKGDAAKPEKDGGEEGDAKKEKKNEAVKQGEVDTFAQFIGSRIDDATQAIEKLPTELKNQYTKNVQETMMRGVEPGDKDRSTVIETGEFTQYQATVTKQVEQSNAQFKELEKKAEASAEGQKEQQKKDEATLEKRREEVRAKLAEMEGGKAEALPSVDLQSPAGIHEAMAQYSSRVAAINDPEKGRVAMLQQAFGLVATLPEKFAEHWKPSGTESAVGGGLVAAGVAASFIPGVNIGVWACAGIGAAVYAGYRAVRLAQLQKEQAELAAEVKKDVAAAKGSLATEQKSIESARAEADKQGQAIGAAPSGVRKKDKEDADTERRRLAKAGMEVRKDKEDAAEVKRQLDTQITERVQVAGRAPGEGKPGAEGKQPPTPEEMIRRSHNLQEYLQSLDLQEDSLGERAAQVSFFEQQRGEQLDTVATEVNETVLNGSLGMQIKALSIKEYPQECDEISKKIDAETPGWYGNTIGHTFSAIGHAWNGVFKHGIADQLAKLSDIPVLGQVANFVGGMGEAIGTMGEGIMHMAAHPVEAAKGIANMFVHPVDSAAAMWKMMSAQEEFAAGNISKGLGKAVANIGVMLLPGVGAANAGRVIGMTAFSAARGAGCGVLSSVARAAWAGGVTTTAELGTMVAHAGKAVLHAPALLLEVPGVLVRGTGALARAPMGILRAGRRMFKNEAALATEESIAANAASALARTEAASAQAAAVGAAADSPLALQATQAAQKAAQVGEAAQLADLEVAAAAARQRLAACRKAGKNAARGSEEAQALQTATRESVAADKAVAAQRARQAAQQAQVVERQAAQQLQTMEQQLQTAYGKSHAELAAMSEQELAQVVGLKPDGWSVGKLRELMRLRKQVAQCEGLAIAGGEFSLPAELQAKFPQTYKQMPDYIAAAKAKGFFKDAKGVFDEKACRVDLAQRIAKRKFTPAEADAVWNGHLVGNNAGMGKIGTRNLIEKARAVRDTFVEHRTQEFCRRKKVDPDKLTPKQRQKIQKQAAKDYEAFRPDMEKGIRRGVMGDPKGEVLADLDNATLLEPGELPGQVRPVLPEVPEPVVVGEALPPVRSVAPRPTATKPTTIPPTETPVPTVTPNVNYRGHSPEFQQALLDYQNSLNEALGFKPALKLKGKKAKPETTLQLEAREGQLNALRDSGKLSAEEHAVMQQQLKACKDIRTYNKSNRSSFDHVDFEMSALTGDPIHMTYRPWYKPWAKRGAHAKVEVLGERSIVNAAGEPVRELLVRHGKKVEIVLEDGLSFAEDALLHSKLKRMDAQGLAKERIACKAEIRKAQAQGAGKRLEQLNAELREIDMHLSTVPKLKKGAVKAEAAAGESVTTTTAAPARGIVGKMVDRLPWSKAARQQRLKAVQSKLKSKQGAAAGEVAAGESTAATAETAAAKPVVPEPLGRPGATSQSARVMVNEIPVEGGMPIPKGEYVYRVLEGGEHVLWETNLNTQYPLAGPLEAKHLAAPLPKPAPAPAPVMPSGWSRLNPFRRRSPKATPETAPAATEVAATIGAPVEAAAPASRLARVKGGIGKAWERVVGSNESFSPKFAKQMEGRVYSPGIRGKLRGKAAQNRHLEGLLKDESELIAQIQKTGATTEEVAAAQQKLWSLQRTLKPKQAPIPEALLADPNALNAFLQNDLRTAYTWNVGPGGGKPVRIVSCKELPSGNVELTLSKGKPVEMSKPRAASPEPSTVIPESTVASSKPFETLPVEPVLPEVPPLVASPAPEVLPAVKPVSNPVLSPAEWKRVVGVDEGQLMGRQVDQAYFSTRHADSFGKNHMTNGIKVVRYGEDNTLVIQQGASGAEVTFYLAKNPTTGKIYAFANKAEVPRALEMWNTELEAAASAAKAKPVTPVVETLPVEPVGTPVVTEMPPVAKPAPVPTPALSPEQWRTALKLTEGQNVSTEIRLGEFATRSQPNPNYINTSGGYRVVSFGPENTVVLKTSGVEVTYYLCKNPKSGQITAFKTQDEVARALAAWAS